MVTAITSASLTTKIKRLPRKMLIDDDNRGGRYPTIARTGDKRLGNNGIFFDDTLTNFFLPARVNFPTTLPTNSRYLVDAITGSSNMNFNSQVVKNSIENFVNFNPQDQQFIPFKEFGLYEQDIKDTGFYQVGSRPEDVGAGFSSNLGSKTQIRFELPISQQTKLLEQTASISYYNSKIGRFELAGYTENPPGGGGNGGNRGAITNFHFPTPVYFGLFLDSKLYNCLGVNTISGSETAKAFTDTSPVSQGPLIIPAILQIRDNANITLNSAFSATSSQVIKMSDYITQPFLLEKCIIELPIKVGPGWSNDTTEPLDLPIQSSPFFITDIGGPAVTISLLNQFSETNRDIILSGTIIPSADNNSTQKLIQYDPSTILRTATGFNSYSTPNAVINCDANGFFTGSTTLHMNAACDNGVYTYTLRRNNDADNSPLISSVNPFGRNMSVSPSGRSYFGKEFVCNNDYSKINANIDLFGDTLGSNDADLNIKPFIDNKNSPYLIFPKDNLILSISKHRSVLNSIDLNYITAGTDYNAPLSSNHDFAINTGSIKMTFYGSLIQTAQEFHDTLNEPLTSNSVHETIDNSAVLDDFDVEYSELLSGTYTDDIVQGIIGATPYFKGTKLNTFDRTLIGSSVGVIDNFFSEGDRYASKRFYPYNTLQQTNRSVRLFDSKQYWDSFAPSIIDIMSADNSAPVVLQMVGFPVTGLLKFDIIEDNSSNNVWTKSFPFTGQYSSLTRNNKVEQLLVQQQNVIYNNLFFGRWFSNSFLISSYVGFQDIDLITSFFSPIQKIDDLYRLFFGFGNQFTTHYKNDILIGSTNVPDYGYTILIQDIFDPNNNLSDFLRVTIPALRGWKYGLISGIPLSPSAVFRRDKFGQPRDMLEQIPNTKFYDSGISGEGANTGISGPQSSPINILFVDKDGKQTPPNRTLSSNLSFEATSSLPYFDGVVRNREEPIDMSIQNLSFVT